MSKDLIISQVAFEEVLETFVTFFQKEYGELLSKDIGIKVYTSKKANKFLQETANRRVRPGTPDYLAIIHSSTHFTFAKAENIAFAVVMLLNKWRIDVGKPLGMADDYYLNTVFFSLLGKCDKFKSHGSGVPNFFQCYYQYIDLSV